MAPENRLNLNLWGIIKNIFYEYRVNNFFCKIKDLGEQQSHQF